MATLYITELSDVGYTRSNTLNMGLIEVMPPLTIQQVTVSTSSLASAAFNSGTTVIHLYADTSCGFTFGTNPTASAATSARLPTGGTRYFAVPPGGSFKVAAIQ